LSVEKNLQVVALYAGETINISIIVYIWETWLPAVITIGLLHELVKPPYVEKKAAVLDPGRRGRDGQGVRLVYAWFAPK
jgi:hypothetical protein